MEELRKLSQKKIIVRYSLTSPLPSTQSHWGLYCPRTEFFELQCQRRYLLTCVTSQDSDQPAHSCSLIRIFYGCIFDSQGVTKALFRLHSFVEWSGSLLFTHATKIPFLLMWLLYISAPGAFISRLNKYIWHTTFIIPHHTIEPSISPYPPICPSVCLSNVCPYFHFQR